MGAVQIPDGGTRVYYQEDSGSIIEMVITNAFTMSGVYKESTVLVPASQVRSNSLVAVSLVADGDTFLQVSYSYQYSDSSKLRIFDKSPGPHVLLLSGECTQPVLLGQCTWYSGRR